MKKILILITFASLVLSSCQKSAFREDELFARRNALESAEPALLMSSIIQKSAYLYQNKGGMGARNLAATVQYLQGNRSSDDNTYLGFRQPKSDLYEYTAVIRMVQAGIVEMNKKGLKSHEGIFRIFNALMWATVTDLYGDIFYTEGLRGQEGILFPKFDEQKDIYPALIQNLKDAVQLITDGKETIDKAYDIMYAGDKTKWVKLANSLRLRYLMRISAKTNVASEVAAVAALPLLADVPDNATIAYVDGNASMSSPFGRLNNDPVGNFNMHRPSKTLVDTLKALNDERLRVWVAPMEKPWAATSDSGRIANGVRTIVQKGYTYTYQWEFIDRSNARIRAITNVIVDSMTLYAGYPSGSQVTVLNSNGSYDFSDTRMNFKISKFTQLFNENAHPLIRACVMLADEVQFLLAEAAVKGMITGNAENFYKKGVEYSYKRWGEALPASYFNNPLAAFPASDKNKQLGVIGLQKWLGLFMMANEAYADYRRTRVPFMENNGVLTTALNPFPLRYRYPESEMRNNASNYQAAIARLNQGDTEFSKIWLVQ